MDWKPGPARTREPAEWTARIVEVQPDGRILALVKYKNWGKDEAHLYNPDGTYHLGLKQCGADLLPPTITLEEAARECEKVRADKARDVILGNAHANPMDAMLAALRHYETIRESVRDE